MAKTKKITFNMITADIPKSEKKSVIYKGNKGEFELSINPLLNLNESMSFVNDVVATCVDMNTGEYKPELLEFAKAVFMLVYYAGFTVPTDINKAYVAVNNSSVVDFVFQYIDRKQYEVLCDAIYEKLEFSKQYISATHAMHVNDLISMMNHVMDESKSAIKELSKEDFLAQMQNVIEITQDKSQFETMNDEIYDDNIIVLDSEDR